MKYILYLCIFLAAMETEARTLRIGAGAEFGTLSAAAAEAAAGDTLLVLNGVYTQRENLQNVRGSAEAPLHIRAETPGSVIYRGGSEAWHLSDVAWLRISGFVFEQQSANGVNIDDGGTYDTPAHDVQIEDCTFRDMDAAGNSDLLKLSGLDNFAILNCRFVNGAADGSGIDMVGCHTGEIRGNSFENMGNNCIQAKGGSRHLRIAANIFRNGGQRALNLGGRTGLEFFRPVDAPFEAADLQVYANVFIGAMAAVAYTGCTNVHVVNNTIIAPERWIFRILQETVDSERFVACGDNLFQNNIVVYSNSIAADVNIGPNTRPESFTVRNNLWYNPHNGDWGGPQLPGESSGNLVQLDPQFVAAQQEDFRIPAESPAVGAGWSADIPEQDFNGRAYALPPSIGAFEGAPLASDVFEGTQGYPECRMWPQPAKDVITLDCAPLCGLPGIMRVYALNGVLLRSFTTGSAAYPPRLSVAGLPEGTYLLHYQACGVSYNIPCIIQR